MPWRSGPSWTRAHLATLGEVSPILAQAMKIALLLLGVWGLGLLILKILLKVILVLVFILVSGFVGKTETHLRVGSFWAQGLAKAESWVRDFCWEKAGTCCSVRDFKVSGLES